jgi:hypothetical protein
MHEPSGLMVQVARPRSGNCAHSLACLTTVFQTVWVYYKGMIHFVFYTTRKVAEGEEVRTTPAVRLRMGVAEQSGARGSWFVCCVCLSVGDALR